MCIVPNGMGYGQPRPRTVRQTDGPGGIRRTVPIGIQPDGPGGIRPVPTPPVGIIPDESGGPRPGGGLVGIIPDESGGPRVRRGPLSAPMPGIAGLPWMI